jgi:hypothetical protein
MRVDYNKCEGGNHSSYILVALSIAISLIPHCLMLIRMVVMAAIPSILYCLMLVGMIMMATTPKALAIPSGSG